MISHRLLAVLALAAAGQAAEVQLADLRFGIGIAPLPDKAEGTYADVGQAPPGVVSGSPRVDTYESGATGVAADISATFGHLNPLGLIYGGAFRYANGEMQLESIAYPSAGLIDRRDDFEAQGYEVDSNTWTTAGLAGHLGLGWAITPSWHLEALGILGFDWLSLDTFSAVVGTNQTFANEGSGLGWTYGGRIGAYWTDSETRWQFGALAEWTSTQGSVRTSYADNTVDFDVTASGIGLRAVIGRRF